MRKAFSFLIVLISQFVYAQEIIIEKTALSEVKIYQSGAYVTRTAKTQLKAGANKVVFAGLSPYINAQSVSVKGTGDATIINVSFNQDYLKERIKPKEIIQLESMLDSLTYKHVQATNMAAVLKEEESLLLTNKSIGGANNGVLADELELMMEYFSKKLASIKEELLENSIREKKIKEQLDKVKNELAQRNANREAPSGDIVAEVLAKSASSASFEISYLINSGVSWYGFYDVRVKDVNSKIDVIYKAKVSQRSGEDWNDAKIRLSTGNPRAGSVKPELYPWQLSFLSPALPLYRISGAERQEKSQPAPASDTRYESMASLPVRVAENQLSNEYIISIPYTIKSDGEEYQVEIQSYSLTASYEYVSAPKLDADAFLTAKTAGWESLTVSPGSANIYFDGAYIGESYINPSTEDTLAISLGRDKRIVVKRDKVGEFSSTKLFGSNRERNFAFDISIKNTKSTAVSITIEDQLPLSTDKEIEVKEVELSGGNVDRESGKVTWQLNLQPNATEKIRFAFKVIHPKNKSVTGL